MLSVAVGFFLLALVAAFFGLSGIAGDMTNIAWVLLVLFIIGFVASLFMGRRSRGPATPTEDDLV